MPQEQQQQQGRARGRPPGSKTKRSNDGNSASTPRKERKQDTTDTAKGPSKGLWKEHVSRANAEIKSYTTWILPGYHKRLNPAAQDLVERALYDSDLADAPADDPRWTQLYQDLHRLVSQPPTSASEPSTFRITDDDINEDVYKWAPSSGSSSASPPPQPISVSELEPERAAHLRSVLPSIPLTRALHATVSAAMTNNKGTLPKDLRAESWDPNSLAALSILIEEIAKSQAKFNAQRTMFAKSPRNQALAAKRREGKEKEKDGKGKAKKRKDL